MSRWLWSFLVISLCSALESHSNSSESNRTVTSSKKFPATTAARTFATLLPPILAPLYPISLPVVTPAVVPVGPLPVVPKAGVPQPSMTDVHKAITLLQHGVATGENLNQTFAKLERMIKAQCGGCMKRPNSDQCLAYDPSIMANTVEEVIQNFPDLAGAFVSAKPQLKEVKVGDVLYQKPKSSDGCTTSVCRKCPGALIDKFTKLNLLPQIHKVNLEKKFRIDTNHSEPDPMCKRIRKSHKQPEIKAGSLRNQRYIREVNSDPDLIGVRHNLTCYRKGDSVEGYPDYLILCSICWVLRVLPPGYYPSYLNEAVCAGDTRCLSGINYALVTAIHFTDAQVPSVHGVCNDRVKQLKVLTNYDSNAVSKATEMTIDVSLGCDCNVKANSGLKPLVLM